MPSKQAKGRKYATKTAKMNNTRNKTEKSRKPRLANKAKRDAILAIDPNAKVTIINGDTYVDGHQVKIEDNMMITVLEKDKINGIYDLVDDDKPIPVPPPIFGEDGHVIDYSDPDECDKYHAEVDDLAVDYGTAEDAHEGVEELAKYATGEITAVEPIPETMWDKLRNKWRAK